MQRRPSRFYPALWSSTRSSICICRAGCRRAKQYDLGDCHAKYGVAGPTGRRLETLHQLCTEWRPSRWRSTPRCCCHKSDQGQYRRLGKNQLGAVNASLTPSSRLDRETVAHWCTDAQLAAFTLKAASEVFYDYMPAEFNPHVADAQLIERNCYSAHPGYQHWPLYCIGGYVRSIDERKPPTQPPARLTETLALKASTQEGD